jgi:hypothetical protein
MKRVISILVAAVLTSTLLVSAAEARSGGGGVGSFGVGVHTGDMGNIADEHAMHRRYAPGCNYPDEAPKAPPWPPYCDQGVDRGYEE